MASWRRTILRGGGLKVTILVNGGRWVFDEVDVRYTLTLATLSKLSNHEGVSLDGPYHSAHAYEQGRQRPPANITTQELLSWDAQAALPAVRDRRDIDIYRTMLQHPRFGGEQRVDWHFRPLTETHATGDKEMFTFSDEGAKGTWPVYSGSSFNLWAPETGIVYAWIDGAKAQRYLFAKRQRQANHSRSAFQDLPKEVVQAMDTLPCLAPRIAFRDVTKFDNSRSCIVALVPPRVILQHKAPYLLRVRGEETDEAFVLGTMSSLVFDWLIRRKVETTMSFGLLNWMPVPNPPLAHPGRQRIVDLAGRLAAVDDRYCDWADAVGVPVASVNVDERPGYLSELDACVARLYGLTGDDLRHLYATFHHRWDHEPWTTAVLEHYQRLDWDPIEETT